MLYETNHIVEQIKSLVNMYDALERYGYPLNQRGFTKCPFHKEDTPSLGVFSGGQAFNCFGCGVKGDVITFVMKLFDIGFKQALVRLNTDFSLGLIGKKADPATLNKIFQKRREEQFEAWYKNQLYFFMQNKFKHYCKVVATQCPTRPHEPLKDEYIEALHNMDWCEYWLEQHR